MADQRVSAGAWSAEVLRSCKPEVLSLIVALLLDPEDLRAVLAQGAPVGGRAWSLAGMIRVTVERVRDDHEFAKRLAERLGRQAGCDTGSVRWSPYQALEAWARRRDDVSSEQIARVLSTLAFSHDRVLTSLAERLCREVQLEAIQRLRSAHPPPRRDGQVGALGSGRGTQKYREAQNPEVLPRRRLEEREG
jgi:hypothetical protein